MGQIGGLVVCEDGYMAEKNDVDSEIYYSQKELAARWKVTESTIKSWREKGIIPFFQLPLTSRILYPVQAILEIENDHTKKKEVGTRKEISKNKRETSVISANSSRKWRI